jgi:hypothetical protein
MADAPELDVVSLQVSAAIAGFSREPGPLGAVTGLRAGGGIVKSCWIQGLLRKLILIVVITRLAGVVLSSR